MIHSNTLFILTKTYPFGKGEEYITAELNVLSQHFNKVILYPNDYYSDNTSHHRDLPKNVDILNLNIRLKNHHTGSLTDYLYLIKNTLFEFIETDDKKFFFKNFKWNLINFWTQYKLASIFSDYLKKNDYDISTAVFYSYWFHKSAILLAILKDKRLIAEFVSRAHSIDLYHYEWGIINKQVKVPPYKMFKLKHVDSVFTVSKHGEHFLKQRFSVYRNKFKTAYLGIIDDVKIKIPKKEDNFHIVTCSDIDINKRVHKLAEALNRITYPVKWTHFGDGPLIKELEKQMEFMPKNIIIELKGRTPNKEVKKYYSENNINLFINLSLVEGLPVSIMEAMMFEMPILATAVYGTPEAVIDGENGFLIDVNFELHALVSKIEYCIEHKEDINKMGKKSREIYLEKFNAEKNYSEFANNLKTL